MSLKRGKETSTHAAGMWVMAARVRLAWTILLLHLVPVGLTSCTGSSSSESGFFTDVTSDSGIDFRLVNGATGEKFVTEIMLGGLGWIDYDADGDYDLYLVNAHSDSLNADAPGKEEDRLYRNDGRCRFTDVTRKAGINEHGYGSGLAVGDYDNDRDADLLVTNFGLNVLYRNNGDGTFTDVTETAGVVDKGYHMGAVWFDMDRDGDLDLYVVRYLRYNARYSKRCKERNLKVYCNPKFYPGETDLLYENLGDGTFREIGGKAGIARSGDDEGRGLGVVSFDYDRDGFMDVYVANDMNPNFLWHNNGDGTFTDVAQDSGVALSSEGLTQAGMGIDIADVNGDALTDIYVTNFAVELNSLYLGGKDGLFRESCVWSGLGPTYLPLGFGTHLVDVDLDGDPDVVTANGHINDLVERTDPGRGFTFRQRPSLFLNQGTGIFEDGVDLGGPPFLESYVGRGLARSDFDGDGDVDFAMMTLDRSVVLLRNENPLENKSIILRLIGTRSPRDAYGSRVVARIGERERAFEYHSTRSYLSASDPRLVIGLAKAAKVDKLTIYWSSGQVQEVRDLPSSGPVTIREPE